MSESSAGGASVFAALYEHERKKGGGGGGGKVKLAVQSTAGKLRFGGNKGVRRFHSGQRLSGQRINNIVKVKFVPNNKDSKRHIMAHLDYIQNREREENEPERKFYGRDGERSRENVAESMMRNRGDEAAMFKIILSPKQNELNHVEYTTEIMRRFEEKTGIVTDWALVEHRNTDYHHVHIVMPGRDMGGNSYRLEKEHLDILRELANEYQYELQDLVYEREKEIQQEFGMARDEANLLIESARDRREMKELGVLNPAIDKQVRDDLLPATNWDNLYFRAQLEREMMASAYADFKNREPDLEEAMAKQPELYQGFIKQAQAQEINDGYFAQLKYFHPLEYERYLNDPTLDRNEVAERLKQAFPDWFDPIVDQLKEAKPELFGNYQKPAATDRLVIENLQETNPALFPELSLQIQENQKNLFALAYLAQHNPELFQKIHEEPDFGKQREMLGDAQKQFPDLMKDAEQTFAAQLPEIYKHGEKTPSQGERLADLAKSNPLVFPQASAQLQKMEVDNVLLEKFKQEFGDLPEKLENNEELREITTNILRSQRPDLLEQATAKVRELQPELFAFERTEPTQHKVLQDLMKEKPELFPEAVQKVKNQEIDRAYLDRAVELLPDRLQKYTDDPSLDRSDLYAALKSVFPDWRPEIEAQLKEKMPNLFRHDSPKSTEQILEELAKSHPHLLPEIQEKHVEAQQKDPLSAKIYEIKEKLINEAYFQRGKEGLSDGLQAYLASSESDRQFTIAGLREKFPEWLKDIENQLQELQPLLFLTADKFASGQTKQQEQKDVLEKLRRASDERGSDGRASVIEEARLLLALSAGLDKLEKQVDEQEKSELDPAKEAQLEEKADNAREDADKFQIGHGWAGLTGIHHGNFIAEKIDLQGEAKALFEDQKELAQEITEANQHAEFIDPKVFQIEDIALTVEERIEEHEKEKDQDERS